MSRRRHAGFSLSKRTAFLRIDIRPPEVAEDFQSRRLPLKGKREAHQGSMEILPVVLSA
jgi:hypothetical protein